MQQKNLFTTVVIVCMVALMGVYAYSLRSKVQNNADVFHQAPLTTSEYAAATPPPEGYIPFSNPKYHLSFYYPPNLAVSEYYGAAGQLTLSFQDPDTNEGFEIFMNPYNLKTITEARFKLDEPSGVMAESIAIVLDSTPATMFFGKNNALGDTREVWFLKYGLLYEVTTYKDLDSWLSTIMKTWKFID